MARIKEDGWVRIVGDSEFDGVVGLVTEIRPDGEAVVAMLNSTTTTFRVEDQMVPIEDPPQYTKHPTRIRYRNYRGEVSDRYIVSLRTYWGSNEWHPEPQWLIDGYDMVKQTTRTFAVSGLLPPETTGLDHPAQSP